MTSEMSKDSKQPFEQQLRATLRDSERELDTQTGGKLSRARRAALEQDEQASRYWLFGRGALALGATAAAALIAVVVLRTNAPLSGQPAFTTAEATPETETVSIEDELELYENLELLEFYEDLEFYEWLADEALEEAAS